MNPWRILLHAHDLIWEDKKSWKPNDRLEACRILFDKSLEVLHEQSHSGSASTANGSESLIERELARSAEVKL